MVRMRLASTDNARRLPSIREFCPEPAWKFGRQQTRIDKRMPDSVCWISAPRIIACSSLWHAHVMPEEGCTIVRIAAATAGPLVWYEPAGGLLTGETVWAQPTGRTRRSRDS